MATPATSADFLDLIRRSQLVETQRLEVFLKAPPSLSAPPKELAERLIQAGLLTRFQAGQLLQGKYKGFSLGKYRVLERIGFGGMGMVFLAEHKVMRRKVALKVLPANQARDQSARDRFYREARAAGQLTHPNLVRAYDIDSEKDMHFLVLEYVDGSSLHDIVTRFGPFQVQRAAHYLWQAAMGLQHVHEAGLVHRDIKPANLILDRQGVVKILDLGLARFFTEPDDGLTTKDENATVLGTADYLAPEQAIDSHEVDIRGDIYSLGATAMFLLTGKPPFEAPTVAQKLVSHQMKPPTPLRQLRPEAPKDLEDVILKMLAKKAEDRFQTPADLAMALEKWGHEIVAAPPVEEMPESPGVGVNGPSSVMTNASSVLRSATRNQLSSQALKVATGSGSGKSKNGPAAKSGWNRRKIAIMAAPVVLLTLGGLGAFWWNGFNSPPSASTPQAAPSTHVVAAPKPSNGKIAIPSVSEPSRAVATPKSKPEVKPASVVGGQGTQVTLFTPGDSAGKATDLREALKQAQPGTRIVLPALVQENLRIADGRGKNIRIEGQPGAFTIWKPPANHDSKRPFLEISGVEGLSLANIVFDGDDRVAESVRLRDACPGAHLHDLTFQGHLGIGLAVNSCTGLPDRPVVIERIRFLNTKAASGIYMLADSGKSTEFVHVKDSRFEGSSRAAVRLSGPLANVDFSELRVWKPGIGFLYERKFEADWEPIAIAVRRSTFLDVGIPFEFHRLPPLERTQVKLEDNLAIRAKQFTRIDTIAQAPDNSNAGWIWHDEGPPGGNFPPGERFFRKQFTIPGEFKSAQLELIADDLCSAFLNGEPAGKTEIPFRLKRVELFDVTKLVRPGKNTLAILGVNQPNASGATNGAGLTARLTVIGSDGVPNEVVATDPSWKSAVNAPADWIADSFDDSAWKPVRQMHGYASYPEKMFFWQSVLAKAGDAPRKLFAGSHNNLREARSGANPYDAPELTMVEITVVGEDPRDDATFLRYPVDSPLATKYHNAGAGPARK